MRLNKLSTDSHRGVTEVLQAMICLASISDFLTG